MRRRPSATHRRATVIRGSAAIMITGAVLGLMLWLPIDRATLVAGMITSLVTSAAPVLLNANARRVEREKQHHAST